MSDLSLVRSHLLLAGNGSLFLVRNESRREARDNFREINHFDTSLAEPIVVTNGSEAFSVLLYKLSPQLVVPAHHTSQCPSSGKKLLGMFDADNIEIPLLWRLELGQRIKIFEELVLSN